MKYIIESFPSGVSAPRSVLESLIGLTVEAVRVHEQGVDVPRKEIVKSLGKKKSMFVRFWRKGWIDDVFNFFHPDSK